MTVNLLDPDVMRIRHALLVSIGIIYLALKSQMLNRYGAVKWLMAVQQPILKIDQYTIYEYIVIISEHQSTNVMSPAALNWCTELL